MYIRHSVIYLLEFRFINKNNIKITWITRVPTVTFSDNVTS